MDRQVLSIVLEPGRLAKRLDVKPSEIRDAIAVNVRRGRLRTINSWEDIFEVVGGRY
jgi:hypothetical protein